MEIFSHLPITARAFVLVRIKIKEDTHTKRNGFTLVSQLGTRRPPLFNVLSDLKSASLPSALSSTDALISGSVFSVCSAGFGKDRVYFFFHHCWERLSDLEFLGR